MLITPFSPRQVQELLADATFRWWIAGGWALDLFLDEVTRQHFDVDVAISRADQLQAQKHLPGWDFGYISPGSPGSTIQPWEPGQFLGHEVHGIWGRKASEGSWQFEFLLHEIAHDIWTFRYCAAVTHPLEAIVAESREGISYLRPEIVLLYKAARMRDVDVKDFARVLPRLSKQAKAQLHADVSLLAPSHPWLNDLLQENH